MMAKAIAGTSFYIRIFSKLAVSSSSVLTLLANTFEERTKNMIKVNLYIRLLHKM
jgi:hypothetical protein